MPEFRPFRGLRYTTDDLDAVTAPPYDVIDPPERDAPARARPAQLGAADPAERGRLPRGLRTRRGDDRRLAGRRHARTRRDARLLRVPDDALGRPRRAAPHRRRARRTRPAGGRRRGRRAPPRAHAAEGEVRPPRAAPRATRANLDPIWGLTGGTGLAAIADRALPLAKTIDETGVTHELGAITDADDVAEMQTVVAGRSRRARRRSPPVRDRDHLPQRAARRGRRHRATTRSCASSSSSPRTSSGSSPSTGCCTASARRPGCGSTSAHGVGSSMPRRTPPRRSPRSSAGCAPEGGVGLVDAEGVARLVRRPRRARCRPRGARAGAGRRPVRVVRRRRARRARRPTTSRTATTRPRSRRWSPPATVDAAILLPPVTVDPDPGRGRRARADAAEDHVLRAEAAHRPRVPHARRVGAPSGSSRGAHGRGAGVSGRGGAREVSRTSRRLGT